MKKFLFWFAVGMVVDWIHDRPRRVPVTITVNGRHDCTSSMKISPAFFRKMQRWAKEYGQPV